MAQFHRLGRSYLDTRVAAQRLVATYFPFVQFMSAVADAIVLGVGAHLIETGHLTSGALIAFLLYIDLFFSPIQQLSQVFDAWQQTRVSVGRIAELMQLDTLTPNPAVPEESGRLHGDLRLDHVRFSYPVAARSRRLRRGTSRRSAWSAGSALSPVPRRGVAEAAGGVARHRPADRRGRDGRARRRDRRRQVDGHEAARALLRPG